MRRSPVAPKNSNNGLKHPHGSTPTRPKRPSLTSFSQKVFGDIYQAITGNVHLPQHFILRAVANGLPAAELSDAIRCAKTPKELPGYFLSLAEQRSERGAYWHELGLKSRARDNYLESALWGIYAELLLEDDEHRSEVWHKFRENYFRAAPYFNSPAESVAIHYLASSLIGYFRMPISEESDEFENSGEKVPVVILLNGLFSPIEELHYLENSLLSQGFATLSVDYPGVTHHTGQIPSAFDVKELGNALNLFLSSRRDLDLSRVTLYGLSLGGRMAMYLALAFPDRFASIVSVSTPLDLLSNLDRLTPNFAREHMVSSLASRSALFEMAHHTPIEDDLRELHAPLLVLGGGKDRIALAEETKHIYDRAGSTDKKLIICPGAGHGLYEMMPSIRYEIAQWIKQRSCIQSIIFE